MRVIHASVFLVLLLPWSTAIVRADGLDPTMAQLRSVIPARRVPDALLIWST